MEDGEAQSVALDASQVGEESKGPTGKRFVAAISSAILPGLGQWILGERKRGLWFALAFGSFLILYFGLQVPRTFLATVASVWLLAGLCVSAAWDALRCKSAHTAPNSAWWIPAALILGMFASVIYTNLLLRVAGYQLFVVPSSSMQPTINLGDRLIADMHFYRHEKPRRGDVVIFRRDNLWVMKRVICAGGCTVEGRNEAVLVDGKPLSESYVVHTGEQLPAPELVNFGPIHVPSGKIFVIGDNRDVSLDSRTFGPIDVSTVVGKPLYIVRPLRRKGIVIH